MSVLRSIFTFLVAVAPLPALAALPVGAAAPDFATQGAKAGKTFGLSLSAMLKRGPVVLYFFPAAFTPGCTIEAHDFAEATGEFTKSGATVIGLAADPIDKLARFSVEECRDKFAVAVATPKMIADYEVKLPLGQRSNRTSFVIDRNGRIAYAFSSPSPQGHVANTLASVRTLQRSR